LPAGTTTATLSPADLFCIATPIGDDTDIFPSDGLISLAETNVNTISSSVSTSTTLTEEPYPTLSSGISAIFRSFSIFNYSIN